MWNEGHKNMNENISGEPIKIAEVVRDLFEKIVNLSNLIAKDKCFR